MEQCMITNHAKDRQMENLSISGLRGLRSKRFSQPALFCRALLLSYAFSVGLGYFFSHCSFVSFSACVFKKLVIFVLTSFSLVRAE